MNFKDAYKEMLKGKKVRRLGWKGYWFIEDNKVFAKNANCDYFKKEFSQEDIKHTIANDWEIAEVVEKSKVWKPKEREPYYYVGNDGIVLEGCNTNHEIDEGRINLGNCFKTKEEAEHMVEKLKVINELKNFALENNGAEIDWKNDNQEKHIITYTVNCEYKNYFLNYGSIAKCLPFNIYFTSREITQKAIETIGEDRIKKYYFDVED